MVEILLYVFFLNAPSKIAKILLLLKKRMPISSATKRVIASIGLLPSHISHVPIDRIPEFLKQWKSQRENSKL